MEVIYLDNNDHEYVNEVLNDCMDYVANTTEEKYQHNLVKRLVDVFEIMNP